MDVERTMQFILDCQAKAEIRMAKMDERMAKMDERMAKMEARIDRMEIRFDKRINAITKIVQTGMKMLAETQGAVKELAVAQKRTEEKFQAFVDSMNRGRNGR